MEVAAAVGGEVAAVVDLEAEQVVAVRGRARGPQEVEPEQEPDQVRGLAVVVRDHRRDLPSVVRRHSAILRVAGMPRDRQPLDLDPARELGRTPGEAQEHVPRRCQSLAPLEEQVRGLERERVSQIARLARPTST